MAVRLLRNPGRSRWSLLSRLRLSAMDTRSVHGNVMLPGSTATQPARRRSDFGLLRLIMVSLIRRRTRGLLSIIALAIGAALMTTLLTVYGGVRANLNREFARYGANVIVTGGAAESMLSATQTTHAMDLLQQRHAGAVGVLYAVAQAHGPEQPVSQQAVIAGSDLARLHALNPTWKVTGRLPQSGEAWLGVTAARQLHVAPGQTFTVLWNGREQTWRAAATVESGQSEDDQILAPLAQVQALTGLSGVTTIEVSATGTAKEVEGLVAMLRQALPETSVSPVRRIAVSEGRIILNTRAMLVASTILILFTIGLCVAAALTSMALERRKDFGIMKAIGGGEQAVFLSFLGESLVQGLLAAVIGGVLGALLAGWIGQSVFSVWLTPGASVFVLTAIVTVLLATLAAMTPWPIVHGATPAAILRGE